MKLNTPKQVPTTRRPPRSVSLPAYVGMLRRISIPRVAVGLHASLMPYGHSILAYCTRDGQGCGAYGASGARTEREIKPGNTTIIAVAVQVPHVGCQASQDRGRKR